MVFYTANMIKKLGNPSIVVVTDRNDLDNQLYTTFAKCSNYLKQDPVQIENREDLNDKLDNRKSEEYSLQHYKSLKRKQDYLVTEMIY